MAFINGYLRIVTGLGLLAATGCGTGGGGGHSTPPSNAVDAPPSIVRHPVDVATHEHGSALLFVVAAGSSLTYEWRAIETDTVIQSGQDPFLMLAGQTTANDGDCYDVRVSNTLGSVTSDRACTSVAALSYDFNEDGGDVEPEGDMAAFFGNALLALTENTLGPLTGPPVGAESGIPAVLGPPQPCAQNGAFLGATLDAADVAAMTPLPLGTHGVSLAFDLCYQSTDQVVPVRGAISGSYDFPTAIGVGSSIVRFSGFTGSAGPKWYLFVMNGTINVTATRSTDSSGTTVDEIRLTPQPGFTIGNSAGMLKQSTGTAFLTVRRTLSADLQTVDTVVVEFADHGLELFDWEGHAATVSALGAVTFHHDGSWSGSIDVASRDQPTSTPVFHGSLVPSAWLAPEWTFDLAPP